MTTPEFLIRQDLRTIADESEHQIEILMAVESGSRAWGFESPDSDYDVRFIYVNRPEWYIERGLYPPDNRPDTKSRMSPDKLYDYHGWDLLKALHLLKKCNPSLLEWLQSPISYAGSAPFVSELAALAGSTWSPVPAFHHYRSMALTNFREYLQGETVRTKKYLYVLRPILAARYIVDHLKQPPLNFDELIAASDWVSPQVKTAISNLLEIKRSSSEVKDGPRDSLLHDFIERWLINFKVYEPKFGAKVGRADPGAFSAFLHRWLDTAWKDRD